MDILLYLTALLETRKTIGIAGLGTLYKKKSPGKYDAEQHAFVPPTFSIAFTSTVQEEEALASHISQERNLSLESANYYIQEFVEKIHTQLTEQQEADLAPIGKLKLVNDELTLVANKEHNFGHESFGLPTLNERSTADIQETVPKEEQELNSIIEENQLEEENPGQETTATESNEVVEENNHANDDHPATETIAVSDDQPVYDGIAEVEMPVQGSEDQLEPEEVISTEATKEGEPQLVTEMPFEPKGKHNYSDEDGNTDEDDDDDDDDNRPNRFLSILFKTIIALILIVILGVLAYFFFPGWFDNKILNKYITKPSIESASTVLPDSTAKDSIINDSLAKNNALVSLVKDSNTVDSSKITIYEVIGSAEKSQKRIDHVINLMKKKGITAKPLQNVPGKLVKISLGTFTDYNAAKKFQDSLKVLLKNPQIYIQSIKPKK